MTSVPFGRIESTSAALGAREALLVGTVLACLIVWLPLQTPIAALAYQYGGIPVTAARAILLLKDVIVAAAVVALLVRHRTHLGLRWYDVAALAYVGLIALYSVVPALLGSDLPFMSVAGSARVFAVPVELYALGRLAVLSGVEVAALVRVFLVASAVAAALTVAQWALTSESFWTSVINMPQFVREVQGLPGALSLWDISILGHYGVGAGNSGQFLRAIGPFTHPVGTGHYFVAPLLLSVARTMTTDRRDPRAVAGWALLALLFAAAVITPISRGSWIAAGYGVLVLGLTLHRVRLALAAVVLTGLFVILVPPFSYSVRSAISFQDSSVIAHGEAVGEGLGTVIDNPIGLGVGQADQFGSAFAGGADAAGVGENMYLSVLVTVGPLGLAALLLWMLGLALGLAPRRDRATSWMRAALFAALAGYAVSAMTSSSLMRFTTSGSFWLLVGLLVLSGPVDVRGGIASARRQLCEVRIPSRSR